MSQLPNGPLVENFTTKHTKYTKVTKRPKHVLGVLGG